MSEKLNIKKAKELHSKGMGWREIGRILGVHPYSVQFALERRGFKSNRKPGVQRRIDWDKVLSLRGLGHTYSEIADIMEISFSAVQHIIKKGKN